MVAKRTMTTTTTTATCKQTSGPLMQRKTVDESSQNRNQRRWFPLPVDSIENEMKSAKKLQVTESSTVGWKKVNSFETFQRFTRPFTGLLQFGNSTSTRWFSCFWLLSALDPVGNSGQMFHNFLLRQVIGPFFRWFRSGIRRISRTFEFSPDATSVAQNAPKNRGIKPRKKTGRRHTQRDGNRNVIFLRSRAKKKGHRLFSFFAAIFLRIH